MIKIVLTDEMLEYIASTHCFTAAQGVYIDWTRTVQKRRFNCDGSEDLV